MTTVDTTGLFEAHPHLAVIDKLWGKRQCRDLLRELMSETRDGTRQGFSPENASTIMRLLMEHDRLFPDLDDSRGGAWWTKELDSHRERE